MRNSRPILLLLASAIAIAACGCGGGSGTTANNNVESITITPATGTNVDLNQQIDFTATVQLKDPTITTNTDVTWQVNGATGGNSTTGTITSLSTAVNTGIYTAPARVPSTNITITAIIVETPNPKSTTTTTITSNSLTVTIGGGQGVLQVSPTQATVPSGGTFQFTALFNSVLDSSATWTVGLASGSCPTSQPDCFGSINPSTGEYSAPNAPPPGGKVTITATDTTDGNLTATAKATIAFSDASLRGPFAFYYAGNDVTGFRAVAGRFVADGAGNIQGGIEDVDSFGSPVQTAVPISSGTYVVGADGRTSATIYTNSATPEHWQFVLTSTSHALLIRFDNNTTGHGTIDQQNLNDLTSLSVISGSYVFRAAGGDVSHAPRAIAGRFTANGAGVIPPTASIIDDNDNGTVKPADTGLSGSYSFDATNSGTGRGTLTLTSTSTGQLQFAFYVIDNTHLYIIETDTAAYLAGEVYSGAAGSSFTAGELSAANYVFTVGGNSSTGAYAAGGVFAADGNGNVTSGTLDSNDAGTLAADMPVSASTYTVDATTGRVDLKLGSLEFAAYPTASNTALLVELDSTAISSGTAYLQAASPATPAGNLALALQGQGVFYNDATLYQSDAVGESLFPFVAAQAGALDINNFGTSPIKGDSLVSGTSLGAQSNGRGTLTLAVNNPPATYTLVYYVVDANTTVFVGQDATRVVTGIAIRQF